MRVHVPAAALLPGRRATHVRSGAVCVLKEVAKAAIIEEAVLPQLRREVRAGAKCWGRFPHCVLLRATPPAPRARRAKRRLRSSRG